MSVSVPVSWGELIDKITILEIKQVEIKSPDALANINREHEALTLAQNQAGAETDDLRTLKAELLKINRALWQIEDDIRDCERQGDFGEEFIRLARAVYQTNDQRAAVKRDINSLMNSAFFEEKSYQDY